MQYKGIILMGPPGAGKDMQANLLTSYGYFNFSSGNMFRNMDRSTDIGAKIGELIDNGHFVPDDLTIALFNETLGRYSHKGLYTPDLEVLILNGIPRTVPQVKQVGEIVDIQQTIYLQVSKEICGERVGGRYKEQKRPEDRNKFEQRWKDFMNLTYPILDIVKPVVVPGKGTIPEVHELIKKAL